MNQQIECSVERNEAFLNLLIEIYGMNVVTSLVDNSKKTFLQLQNSEQINRLINCYQRQPEEGCKRCKLFYPENPDFKCRSMDFPSWRGNLDFRKKHAKRIMIIGEDISPAIKKPINVAYGLGKHPINNDGTIEEEKLNKLWFNLNKLANGQLQTILENIYVTDTSKCHAFKNQNIWKSCSKIYLKKEIELIYPKVIIFQGKTSYKRARIIFEGNMIEEETPSYFVKDNFTRIGKIVLANQDPISFIKIYHTSIANRANWNTFDNDDYKRLFKDKILSEL